MGTYPDISLCYYWKKVIFSGSYYIDVETTPKCSLNKFIVKYNNADCDVFVE